MLCGAAHEVMSGGYLSLLLLLLLSLGSVVTAQPARPTFSIGSLELFHSINNITASDAYHAAECSASAVADFSSRLALPQWNSSWVPHTFEDKRQGPYLLIYPRVSAHQAPEGCDSLAWAHERLLAAAAVTIHMGLNYCHFRAPGYEAPEEVRLVCVNVGGHKETTHNAAEGGSSSSNSSTTNNSRSTFGSSGIATGSTSSSNGCVWMMTSICNTEGFDKAVHPWRGLDCSNFIAWIYNFAFGYYPTTNIGESACHPTYAPGRLLHNITTRHLDLLSPGDLVFGRQSRRHGNAPSSIRHVALWTGYSVDFDNTSSPLHVDELLKNVPQAQWPTYLHCMAHQRALGRPVYVIADSNYAGPAYRPFCGAYLNNFSHARRILAGMQDGWPLSNSDAIARWDVQSKSCKSLWALTEHSGNAVAGHQHDIMHLHHTRPHNQHVRHHQTQRR